MKKFGFIYILAFGIVLHACQTTSMISIDYLVPAEISFPKQIRRVGIVNNVSDLPGRIKPPTNADSVALAKSGGLIENYTLNGDPKIATESLSETLAAENYFDEVVIYDLALQEGQTPNDDHHLNREEVEELTQSLDVDMLISLEQIRIKVHRVVHPMDQLGFLGTVEAKVLPKINLYIANRNNPLMMINGNDSIFWEEIENSKINAQTRIVPDRQLIAEASGFAGTIPVKYITPSWHTAQRFLYSGGSAQMRDAAFFLQKNDWDNALKLWETIYAQQKGKKKLRAASNIALYYEMKDDLDNAYEWGIKALEQAKVADNISEDNEALNHATDYARIRFNLSDVIKRRAHFVKLKMQMDRFNDDF